MKETRKNILMGLSLFATLVLAAVMIFIMGSLIHAEGDLEKELKDVPDNALIRVSYENKGSCCAEEKYEMMTKKDLLTRAKGDTIKIISYVPEKNEKGEYVLDGQAENPTQSQEGPTQSQEGPTQSQENPTDKPEEPNAGLQEGQDIYLDQVHMDEVTNEDGTKEPVVIATVKLAKERLFGDVYIFKGKGTDDANLIAIQTGQLDVDVFMNPAEPDGTRWAKFTGRVYWMDNKSNIPNPDDEITIAVTAFNPSLGQESGYSNVITGKYKDFFRK